MIAIFTLLAIVDQCRTEEPKEQKIAHAGPKHLGILLEYFITCELEQAPQPTV